MPGHAEAARTVTFVGQYTSNDKDWNDLSRRDTAEQAWERIGVFKGEWARLKNQDGHPSGYRVVCREIIDTVVPEPEPGT
jgi:hypothetical protein